MPPSIVENAIIFHNLYCFRLIINIDVKSNKLRQYPSTVNYKYKE